MNRLKLPRRAAWRGAIVAAATMIAGFGPLAEARAAWPEKQVTVIVPFGAGGTTDVVGRLLADFLQTKYGQPFVVENRPGAGGNVGLTAGAKAPADGYTLVMVSVSTQAINPFIYNNLGYDAVKDFDGIGLIVETPNILVVKNDLPVKTLAELVDLMKQKPEELSFGSAGIGTSQHLGAELLLAKAGVKATHIPFKGSGEIMQNLIGGHIDWSFDNLPATSGPIAAKQIRPIAISSLERNPNYPDIPAIAETYPGFSAGSWLGLMAPAGAPKEVIAMLSEDLKAFLDNATIAGKLADLKAIPAWRSPEGYADYVQAERTKWEEVVKTSGAKVE